VRALTVLAVVLAGLIVSGPALGARLSIPRIGLEAEVGVVPSLARGPGFYPGTGRPGQKRTIAIAGHRTTHTRPFWSLDSLHRGDVVTLSWRGRRYAYRVTGIRIVRPSALWILRERGAERLVLTACHPRGSAAWRIAVFAWPVKAKAPARA
jgi:sortase A